MPDNSITTAFEVYCADSDKTVIVKANQTIAGALAESGIDIDLSCEQGICGTCITDVIKGEPEHRDCFLTDEEKQSNTQMTICCSRAKSARLILKI